MGEDPDPLLFTTWPTIEDMSLDDLTQLDDKSINWLGSPELGFQYDTAQSAHLGRATIFWSAVPQWVSDGFVCIVC